MVVESEQERSSSASDRRRRRVARLVGTVLIVAAATGCTPDGQISAPQPQSTAVVDYVVDGDTVDLTIDGQVERVRLIGIDTPESVSRDDPVQCFGIEASDALRGLLPEGTAVRIERDAEARDRFGRLLLYVYRADDDLFVNRWLVDGGFADTLFFEPNTSFETEFTRARNEARSAELGLWGACDGPDQPVNSIPPLESIPSPP